MTFTETIKTLPILGIGLGLRRSMFKETLENRAQIDWLEIVPENYFQKGGLAAYFLQEAMQAGFPIVSHGVNLSIGSTDPLNEAYLDDLNTLFQSVNPPWFSDHLSFSHVDGVYFNDLIPLPHSPATVSHVVNRIQELKAKVSVPFLLENASYYCAMDTGELTEAQFITQILEQADCGLMLDVNNVYVNAMNHHYDPIAFLESLPMERVVQLHIAGHFQAKHFIIDTHGEAICQEVYALLDEVLIRTPNLKAILLERDQNFPDLSELLAELQVIRQRVEKYRPELLVKQKGLLV